MFLRTFQRVITLRRKCTPKEIKVICVFLICKTFVIFVLNKLVQFKILLDERANNALHFICYQIKWTGR